MTTFLTIVLIFAVTIGLLLLRGALLGRKPMCKDYPPGLRDGHCS